MCPLNLCISFSIEQFPHPPGIMPSSLQLQHNTSTIFNYYTLLIMLLITLYTVTIAQFGALENGRQHLRQISQNDLVNPLPYLSNEPQHPRHASRSGFQYPPMSTGPISSSLGRTSTQKSSVDVIELPSSPSKNRGIFSNIFKRSTIFLNLSFCF